MLSLVLVFGYFYFLKPQEAIKPEETKDKLEKQVQKTEESTTNLIEVAADYKKADLLSPTTPEKVDLSEILNSFPAEWGSIVGVNNYYKEIADFDSVTFKSSNNKIYKIKNVYRIDFSNNTKIVYQANIDSVHYERILKIGKCVDFNKQYHVNYGDYDVEGGNPFTSDEECYFKEEGFYNTKTRESVIISGYPNFDSNKSYEVTQDDFEMIDAKGKETTSVFSPLGNIVVELRSNEGWEEIFINTKTGNRTRAAGGGTLVNFSSDERTFVVRGLFSGPNGKETHFTIVQGKDEFEILPKLIPNFTWAKSRDLGSVKEIDPRINIKVNSVTYTEVKFDIMNDNQYYKKGSYTYSIAEDKLIRN